MKTFVFAIVLGTVLSHGDAFAGCVEESPKQVPVRKAEAPTAVEADGNQQHSGDEKKRSDALPETRPKEVKGGNKAAEPC